MTWPRGRLPAVLCALLALSVGPLTQTVAIFAVASAVPGPPVAPSASAAVAAPSAGPPAVGRTLSLAAETGLSTTIDSLSPASLEPGRRVRLVGTVTNGADYTWFDAQVYLSISPNPATTKGALDVFALDSDDRIAELITPFGLFDQIGALRPGETKGYRLAVPYSALKISGEPGAYHVGVSVLGRPAGEFRDQDADSRADTVMALPPDEARDASSTEVVTLIPVTAPVARHTGGDFADDLLAGELATGGRLRNLVDFAAQSPPGSLDLIVDPALLGAVTDMTAGYVVRTLGEDAAGEPGHPGEGQRAAVDWLAEFDAVTAEQRLSLMPYGNPDSSQLVAGGLSGVVGLAVSASRQFAFDNGLVGTIVSYQNNGASARRGLSVARQAGASIQVLSQETLTRLEPEDDNGYPPPVVSVASKRGPLTTLVARAEIAGERFTPSLSAFDYRQGLLAEATVRAISSTESPTSIVAAPFQWNPGPAAASTDLAAIGTASTISVGTVVGLSQRAPVGYSGPVRVTGRQREMPDSLLESINRLRLAGRVYVDLLTEGRDAATAYNRQVAMAGSAWWPWLPTRGPALVRRSGRAMSALIAKVTVTGPEFVALSGDSGRFPLTVANGLDVPVRFTVDVVPRNPALRIDPVDPIVLEAGQKLDIEVVGQADGSGLTAVKARLATTNDQTFGTPWAFDIRATNIGLAIWIFMGVLGGALFSSAAVRIVKRLRSGGFTPRGETSL